MKILLIHHIHAAVQQIVQVLHQSDVIQEALSLGHVDQEIDIAVWGLLTSSNRPEQAKIARTIP
jgi:hypothetical protein